MGHCAGDGCAELIVGWGGGWGNYVPDTARVVAKAFYEGRRCKRGNCETDGMSYSLEGTAIAWRENIALEVAYALENDGDTMRNPHRGAPIFSFAGWPTKMTARHLRALGVDANAHGRSSPIAEFRSIKVDADRWYTPAEIATLQPVPVIQKPERKPRFVNLTLPLFA